MKKLIDFTDRAIEMVEFIQKAEGHKTFISALHTCIAQYHDGKYFNKYKSKIVNELTLEEDLTVEQICEKKGGTVTVREGIPVCSIKISENMTQSIPLSMRERIETFQKD